MQYELIEAIVLTVVSFLISVGTITAAIAYRKSIFQNVWGCLVLLGAILLIGSIFIAPLGVEVYDNTVLVLDSENVNGSWNVYFKDNGNVYSIRCTEKNPWHTWKNGEVRQMQYGRVVSLYDKVIDNKHYQIIES